MLTKERTVAVPAPSGANMAGVADQVKSNRMAIPRGKVLPEITALGASLVEISPQLPEHNRELARSRALGFPILTGRPGRSSRIPWAPGNPKGATHEDRGGEGMYWIVTLIVGGVVGWLASILMKTNAQMGIIANIVVGIIGSSLGFWLAGVLGLSTGGPIVGWIVAVLGAALLIFILKAVGIFT